MANYNLTIKELAEVINLKGACGVSGTVAKIYEGLNPDQIVEPTAARYAVSNMQKRMAPYKGREDSKLGPIYDALGRVNLETTTNEEMSKLLMGHHNSIHDTFVEKVERIDADLVKLVTG